MPKSFFNYLQESHQILKASIHHIEKGDHHFYRVCALQLRLLLCDTAFRHNRLEDISLINKVSREISFHRLSNNGTFELHIDKVPLEKWLDQVLPGQQKPKITIRHLIRCVCDQDGGAHVDPKPNAGVHSINNYETWIYQISEYIAKELEVHINQTLVNH